ncbi:MAG: hypothetical protein NTY59_01485 [Alphaproteobacteria bacterium]|nr:hypothetical protein [Alphaproteobacteria bacterium]
MSRAREAAYALFGAYRLARLDPSGLQYFNATVRGFWRSFLAALIVAPGYAILIGLELTETADAASLDWGSIALVQAVFYAISWTAFPLAMHYLTALIDRHEDYVGYIVAYNWAAVVQMGVMLPAAALQAMIPGDVGGLIMLPVVAATAFYQWFIARTALRISRGTAAGIVGFDFALSLFIAGIAATVRGV